MKQLFKKFGSWIRMFIARRKKWTAEEILEREG